MWPLRLVWDLRELSRFKGFGHRAGIPARRIPSQTIHQLNMHMQLPRPSHPECNASLTPCCRHTAEQTWKDWKSHVKTEPLMPGSCRRNFPDKIGLMFTPTDVAPFLLTKGSVSWVLRALYSTISFWGQATAGDWFFRFMKSFFVSRRRLPLKCSKFWSVVSTHSSLMASGFFLRNFLNVSLPWGVIL